MAAHQRKPIVGGNWKCNPKTLAEANELISAWRSSYAIERKRIDVYACPIVPHLLKLRPALQKQGISACAQNISKDGEGAFTGEITAGQLKDGRVNWTLVGHSERRSKYGESDEDVAQKVEKALEAGLNVVVAIGEQLEEREAGKTNEINERMLKPVIAKIKNAEQWEKVVIAYEPVWAIGTGKVATPDQAEETQAAIRAFIAKAVSDKVAERLRIQYGGSVTPENCGELIKKPNIDGFLVGGASLKPSFMDIVSQSVPAIPKKKPTFGKVKDLNPDSKGSNIMLKCVEAAKEVEGGGIYETVCGDDTGIVTISFKDKALCDLCTPGASIRLQNSSVRMVKGYIRLVVDKWSAFKKADEACSFEVSSKTNVSKIEYELVSK